MGMSGNFLLSLLTIEALGQAEDYLIFAADTDEGILLDEDSARRILSLTVRTSEPMGAINAAPLQAFTERRSATLKQSISERNGKFFEEEAAKLDGWAEDLKITLERDIKDMDRQIGEAKRAARLALSLEEKLAGQKQIKNRNSQAPLNHKSNKDVRILGRELIYMALASEM
jgi:adenine-specific DNA-methyltransferase